MIEAKACRYEDFPESNLASEGMKVIEVDRSLQFAKTNLNVEYSVKDGISLHLQIIFPPMEIENDNRVFPLVVYVQGSAWMKQELGQKMHGLCEFAVRGYIVAIVEYRPSDVAPFPAQVKDTKTAIRFLQEHSEKYHINKENIFVWGDSSGGHTAVMVAATMDEEYNDEDGHLNVKAFVDYYGPMDLLKMNDQPSIQNHMLADSPEGLIIGRYTVNDHPEMATPVSPMNHMSAEMKIRPLIIFHGNKDRLVPFEQSILLYEKLKSLGKTVEFYQVKGADHSEDVFFKKPIFDLVENFLKKYM